MTGQDRRSHSFVNKALVLLEERFPWLSKEDEQVSGADTVDQLTDLYRSLVEERTAERRNAKEEISNPLGAGTAI
jgi:hypothetical protein